jgi:hypothetical protein
VSLQASPLAGPVAFRSSGAGAGVHVNPGSIVNSPVGAAGVPPQMQAVAASACGADSAINSRQAAVATLAVNARDRIWVVVTTVHLPKLVRNY